MTFQPVRVAISGVTNANPAVVTTVANHNLTTGQVVRVHVPKNFGMVQLNQLLLSITVLSATTFSLQYSQVPYTQNVNSINYTPFTIPSNPGFTAEILPVGSGTTPVLNTPVNILTHYCATTTDDALTSVGTVEQPFGQGN